MYQSVDDIPLENDDETAQTSGRLWPLAVVVAGTAAIIALAFWFRPGTTLEPGDPLQAEPQARAAYLQAIGETDPALRRARLRDFLNQNPENPRAPAAQAQLYVLDDAESRAWQATVSSAYDPGLTQDEKLAALDRFQQTWGRFLGGRDAEIKALRTEVETAPEDAVKPDRSLPDGPSPFPSNVPDTQLAGGPRPVFSPPPIIVRPTPTPAPRPVQPVAEIVPARERRSVKPRYPRNAERRGVEAVVTLSLNIDERGRVAMTEVVSVEAERYERDFIRAAERAAMRTRFYPKTVDGKPVAASGVRKRYRFES
jgi:protein TonB